MCVFGDPITHHYQPSIGYKSLTTLETDELLGGTYVQLTLYSLSVRGVLLLFLHRILSLAGKFHLAQMN